MENAEDDFTTAAEDVDGSAQKIEEAFLVINGFEIFPLKLPLISIGRRIDNVLVLNDPRVSRQHAELRAIRGRFVLFDMDSSGGTFVNGKRITHSVVYDGDVISLAGVRLIFRQKDLPRPDLNKTAVF